MTLSRRTFSRRPALATLRPSPSALVLAGLALSASGAWAVEYGTVISSTPVVAAVNVPQRVCTEEPVSYQQPNTGGGALLGAIAGAAIGNTLGAGGGRAAATGIGMIAGSVIGDQAEANGKPPITTTAQRCRKVMRAENRTVGYDVVYEYQGVRRSARVAQDPGAQIALNVNVGPVESQAPSYSEAPVTYETPPTVYAPPQPYYGPSVVVAPAPIYPVVVGRWGWRHRY